MGERAPAVRKASILQFIKFGLVGVLNTLVNYVVYIIFVALGVHYLIANTLGFIISVLNAYFWGSRFVFREDGSKPKRVWWQVLLKTYAAYLFGFLLNQFFLWLWISAVNVGQYLGFAGDILNLCTGVVGVPPHSYSAEDISNIAAPIINIFITVPINFVTNKFWAYRQKKNPPDAKVSLVSDDITGEGSSTGNCDTASTDIERS